MTEIISWVRHNSRLVIPLIIFVVVTAGLWVPRISIPYLTDDTLAIVANTYYALGETDPAELADLPDKAAIISEKLGSVWRDSPSQFDVYRPLEILLSQKLLFWPYDPMIPTLFHAIILGLTAVLIYLLTMELTRKKWVALGSAFLFAFSTGSLKMTWYVIYSQALIVFFIVLGLYAFIRFTRGKNYAWLIVLIITGLIAPFFRELVIIMPITIAGVMIFERNWNKPLLVAMPLLLGHAWFPSFLPNLLLYGDFIFYRAFRGGFLWHLSQEPGSNPISILVHRFTDVVQPMPFDLALFIAPVITVIALGGISWFIYTNRKRVSSIRMKFAVIIPAVVLLVVFIFVGLAWKAHILSLVLYFTIMVAGLKFGRFFSIWLAVSSLPLIVIYIGYDSHIWPALIPWAIIIMLWVDYAFSEAKQRLSSVHTRQLAARSVYVIIILFLIIGFVDQGLNITAVRTAWNTIGRSQISIGERLSEVPEDSMVIANYAHAVDLEYFAHGHVQHYLSYFWRGYIPGRVLVERLEFEKAVSRQFPENDVYILAETGLGAPHPYIDEPAGDMELIETFDVHGRYYFIDPLKHLIPHFFWKKTCPIEYQPSYHLEGGLFYREYNQGYDLYKLTSLSAIKP